MKLGLIAGNGRFFFLLRLGYSLRDNLEDVENDI